MQIIDKLMGQFKASCEATSYRKILLNICDYVTYGLTDSNIFYRNYYIDQVNDYKNNPHPLGSIIYTKLLSYHIMANMSCVVLPKTNYNLQPFKLDYFKKCCNKLIDYINDNEIEELHTPIFGTKLLEGNWNDIMSVLKNVGDKTNITKLYIYRPNSQCEIKICKKIP